MIENLEYLEGITPLAFSVKGPDGMPLAASDDIAVKILIDEDEDYAGYLSLTEFLTQLSTTVLQLHSVVFKLEENQEETPEIDTLLEVYNVLSNYTNILKVGNTLEIDEVTEELITSLFNEKS